MPNLIVSDLIFSKSDEETNSSASWMAWGWVHFQCSTCSAPLSEEQILRIVTLASFLVTVKCVDTADPQAIQDVDEFFFKETH